VARTSRVEHAVAEGQPAEGRKRTRVSRPKRPQRTGHGPLGLRLPGRGPGGHHVGTAEGPEPSGRRAEPERRA
jgi:hypothetical protein